MNNKSYIQNYKSGYAKCLSTRKLTNTIDENNIHKKGNEATQNDQ